MENGEKSATTPAMSLREEIDLGATLAQLREVSRVQGEQIGELTAAMQAQTQSAERRATDIRDLIEAFHGIVDIVRELQGRIPQPAAAPGPETELGARIRAATHQAAVLYAYLTDQADLTTREDLDTRINVLGDDYQCIILEMAELARQLGQEAPAEGHNPDEEAQVGAGG